MNLLFINLPFTERIVRALCWALVHSLWQGVLLAVVTGLVILLTRRSRPGLRYGLFSVLFFLFFLGSCLTFLRQWDLARSTLAGGIVIRTDDRVSAGITVEKGVNGAIALPAQGNWMEGVVNYFNEHAYFIVALWLLFFSLRLVRIMTQLGAQQRIRHYRVHSPSGYWTERLGELASRLKIKVRVRLLESEIIKVPMVAGFIKPVILLPFSILSQLSPSQVEAILLHELAHIRRSDYIVNLLFSLGEMFFFFNPGVLWICSLIREERENCCDDIAVGQAGSKKEFISALVSFQDYDRKAGRYGLAFPGSGEHLLQRVRRIVYRDNKTLDSREKFFLICCFLISGALMLAFTHAAPQDHPSRPHYSPHPAIVLTAKRDTTGKDTMAPMEPLQPAQPVKHDTLKKEKIRKEIREGKDTFSMEDEVEFSKKKSMLDKEVQKMRMKMEEQQRKDYRQESAEQQEQLEQQEKRIEAQQDRLNQEEKRIVRESRRIAEESQRIEEEKQQIAEQKMAIEDQQFKKAATKMKNRVDANDAGALPDQEAAPAGQKVLTPIIDKLMQEHLIDDKEFLSFSLNNNELIVNGVRQSDDIFGRFRDKFIHDARDRIFYSRKKDGSESTEININSTHL